ncbi:hypothetical protein [Spirosoma foliorum]|uniref:Uncharacterized protein n=1 Tax=Spirosoma foliorum TaxID=2710596 RepID=A0A7G5H6F3_9BACT|nr:hypothetical protein [Spirosoma foliorum]QMW06695.1 hypothetical protein H3H32_18285 [Spirosoma foliorum]
MHCIHEFRGNFGQPAQVSRRTDGQTELCDSGVEVHDSNNSVRNVCFVWENGHKAFFNYAYLVSVDLTLIDDLNVMMLYFSGQVVTLKGYCLGVLFDMLLNHTPKTIIARNLRYYTPEQTESDFVAEITVTSE